jgi:hypothetical protein
MTFDGEIITHLDGANWWEADFKEPSGERVATKLHTLLAQYWPAPIGPIESRELPAVLGDKCVELVEEQPTISSVVPQE